MKDIITIDSRICDNPYLHKSRSYMDRFRKIVVKSFVSTGRDSLFDTIHNITKADVIYTRKSLGGYFDLKDGTIAINNDKSPCGIWTALHELGHYAHWVEGYDFAGDKTISHAIIEEQEVESFAAKAYFDLTGLHKDESDWAYYSKSDIIWLSDYYKGFKENDLILK